jgi:hypothetical protein
MNAINALIATGGQQPDYGPLAGAIKERQARNKLQDIMASPDPVGAAMKSGNAEFAKQISQQQSAQRQQKMDQAKQTWQLAQWADTPEKWSQGQAYLKQNFGIDTGNTGFDQRDNIIGLGNRLFSAPEKISKNDRIVNPVTGETVIGAAPEPVDYNKPFLPDGTANSAYQDYSLRKAATGRPQTNVSVSGDKSFATQIGSDAVKQLSASKAAADGAVQTINTAGRIRAALDSGQVTAGPGASAIQFFNQIAGGDPQKVVATRQTIQGLAQLTLSARSALKGQGQISDFEGKLLAKAASGDIDSMTVPEIRTITDVAESAARSAIQRNSQNVAKARKQPGVDNLVDFYDVAMPAPYQPTQTQQAAQPQQGGVARVNSDADFDKLPSGTVFVGPDGKQRKKP